MIPDEREMEKRAISSYPPPEIQEKKIRSKREIYMDGILYSDVHTSHCTPRA
jgi:hypothetical protein